MPRDPGTHSRFSLVEHECAGANAHASPGSRLESLPPASRTNALIAWHHFIETGEVRHDLLRPHVARSWLRAASQGCSPRHLHVESLSPEDTRVLLEGESKLIEAARPYLAALSRAAGEHRHTVILADREARVVAVAGNGQSRRGPDRSPCPGMLLSERIAGCNGIGTPLAEKGYVELVGPEHFIERFHSLTCQGTPIFGPDEQIAGVLGVSVRRQVTAGKLRDILLCAARGVGADLIARDLSHAIYRLQRTPDAAAYAKLREDMIQLQAAARLRFEAAAQRTGKGHDADSVAALLIIAERLINAFRKRVSLCRILVSEDQGSPVRVDIARVVHDIAELLATEASIRGVSIELRADADIDLVVNLHRMAQRLWHHLLDLIEGAEPRDVVVVETTRIASSAANILCQLKREDTVQTLRELFVPDAGDRSILETE